MTLKFDIRDFKLDPSAKSEGVWVDFGGGAAFKLASFDNPAFTEAFRKAIKPYQDLGRKVPEDEQIEIMCQAMADHIVLDWRGVYDGDKELKYSRDAAYRLLKELEWIRNRIINEARDLENFKAQQAKETEGN